MNTKSKKALAVLIVFVLGLLAVNSTAAFAGGDVPCGCVRSPGYWKNHPEAWPGDWVIVGEEHYTNFEAIEIMEQPVKGDKTLTMFPALVAAKLNKRVAPSDCIRYTIYEANAWMLAFPVGSGVKASSEAWQYSHGEALYERLDAYNNGLLCAPACD